METEELVTTYERLQEILRSAGLGWVVEQVTEQVRLGIPEEREVPVYKEEQAVSVLRVTEGYQPALKTGRKAKFESVREVTPRERVVWLLDAAEEAVIRVAEIEDAAIGSKGALQSRGIRAIEFVSEENTIGFSSGAEKSATRVEAAIRVKALLDELRGAL